MYSLIPLLDRIIATNKRKKTVLKLMLPLGQRTFGAFVALTNITTTHMQLV